MQPLLFCLVAATTAALVADLRMVAASTAAPSRDGEGGRIEFCRRECHVTEEMAGIAFLCRNTFLVGNSILGCVDQILTGANDANDGEDADGYGEVPPAFGGFAQFAVYTSDNMRWNVTATAATAAFGGRFKDLGTKYDGIHDLNDGNGRVGSAATELRGTAEIVFRGALEDADVALTAEEHDLFLQYRNALKFLNAPGTDACLKAKLDVEFDVDGVETAVKGNGGDVDLCPGDASTLDANVGRVRDNVVSKVSQQHANVFKAIPITTGIENTVGFNADRISGGRGRAGEFVICHKRIPPCEMEALTGNALL